MDEEVGKVLRDLPLRLQSASIKERKDLFSTLSATLESQEVTEPLVKVLCRGLLIVLPRYHDKASQACVNEFVLKLVKLHPNWTSKYLTSVLLDVASSLLQLVPTKNTGRSGLFALQWSVILVDHGLTKNSTDDSKAELSNLVEIQSKLFSAAVGARYPKITRKAYKLLSQMWILSRHILEQYQQIILGSESHPHLLIFGACLLENLSAAQKDVIPNFKTCLLDWFIKLCISCKTEPGAHIVSESKGLLSKITLEECKTQLIPALSRAMLRNPEVILPIIFYVITNLDLDLSQVAADFSKSLSGSLVSTNTKMSELASNALHEVGKKCLQPSGIEAIFDHLFNVFNGSEGKLTLPAPKICILETAGRLVNNSIAAEELELLSAVIAKHFVKVLQTEVHEKTLITTLQRMSPWCSNFKTFIPENISSVLLKGLENKSLAPALKIAYIECLGVCYQGETLGLGLTLVPQLMKSVEKAAAQSSQVMVVSEGISAAWFLAKLSQIDEINSKSKYDPLWNSVLDMDKQIFVSDKITTQISDETLISLVRLCNFVINKKSDSVTGSLSPLYKVLVYGAISCNKLVHETSSQLIKPLISLSHQHSIALIVEFSKILSSVKVKSCDKSDREVRENSADSGNEVTTKSLRAGLLALTTSEHPYNHPEALLIAKESLLPSHHPHVYCPIQSIWLRILKFHKLDPGKIIGAQKMFIQVLIDEFKIAPMEKNALFATMKYNAEVLVHYYVKKVSKILNDAELNKITDDDYFTYLTPEGELYDKSVITNSETENSSIAVNVKRESKAYSFKEQQEEMQLRKELEEKKRKEGKIKEPEYTPKQKEAIKAQLQKESAIRKKLTQLQENVQRAKEILSVMCESDSVSFSFRFKDLLPLITRNMQSPIAAPHMTELIIKFSTAVFPPKSEFFVIGQRVVHNTLRLLKPKCALDPAWEAEDLSEAASKVVRKLHESTNLKDNKKPFPSPTFCFCIAFLKPALLSLISVNPENELIAFGISFIANHATLRKDPSKTLDLNDPKHMPRKMIYDFLFEVICLTQGRIQQQACNAVVDVAFCASGEEGCDVASTEEIDSFLCGLQNGNAYVRDSALRGMLQIVPSLPTQERNPKLFPNFTKRIWVAQFDSVEENKNLAKKLWDTCNLSININGLCNYLLEDVTHPVLSVQEATACALAAYLEESPPELTNMAIKSLLKAYKDKLTMLPPKMDMFGHVIEEPVDVWEPRVGIALALTQLAPLLSQENILKLIAFYVSTGLADRQSVVREHMLQAALAAVEHHGKDNINSLLPVFEQFLDKAPKSAEYDSQRHSVVVLMGSLARHLDKDDKKIKPIVQKLIKALATPSQPVQEAVANCLVPLVPSIKDDAQGIIKKLLQQLFNSNSYGERKGAAYGLAGMVKGLGILALKQFEIMGTLTSAIQNKKSYKHREGALFAFEQLCHALGRLFEPYIIHVLPHLLSCFGDSNNYVREATDECAKVIMGKLSAHGVKLVLPALLAALDEDSWRTKTGSVELLGAMAYCAPKQLSSCLPSIVPKLIQVLNDSHIKVQQSGNEALKVIGSVIRNPEIQAIVPVLLEALQDPSRKTAPCLQTLLDTKFVHFIDAPSLALIMPVVQRAFMDRSTETRKMAAQIIGNMYSLTDQKDLTPYLPTIIPGLKTSLLDPVPEVRSVSARALGAMVRGMGESSFEDLLPWLMQTLTSETSSVDRSGAAQGLSEVVGGLGVEKLHKLMPDIIATAERSDIAPHVKDGYIMMFIYMPVVFTNEFTPYIGQIIKPILKALADENEFVRDTALKAGQRIVNLYADSAILLLLPELEKGLFDDNWRIRFSSVQLLGDLLYRISGVSGKMTTETADEDDNFGTEQSHVAIIEILGPERRNRVLAGLYMGRSDVSLMVRQAALHVWKVVVTNTPRTLREILPTLFLLLLGCLASTSYDKRQVAARTLGDLVRKLGERVLPEIIPILEKGLESDEPDQRQGVCIGLSEIMASTSREMILAFVNSLVPTVRKALCDPLPQVREAAAKTFDSLHANVGVRALDDILPVMLEGLNNEDPELAERTLDGLRQVMAIKSRVVLPYLVPQLTAPPVNTKALSILAAVAGDALTKHLGKILPSLLTALSESSNSAEELEYCQAVVLSVYGEAGIRIVIDQLLDSTKSEKIEACRSAVTLLCAFCTHTKADYTIFVPQLLRGLIHLMTSSDQDVLMMSWEALNSVIKTLDPAVQTEYVSDIRQAVRFAISDMKGQELLPGFCLPKGITHVLPVFREAILNGPPEVKEQAAQGLSEVIRVTSAKALQPSVVQITGPMIRILGDRFNWSVRAAVLETLAVLLAKVGIMLRQFLPQLQTTFLKALNDTNRTVRLKAASALSHLIVIHNRVDPLFSELHTTIRTTDDSGIRETSLQALRGVITPAGDKMTEPVRKTLYLTLIGMLGHPEDITRTAASGCLGALCRWLSPEQLNTVMQDHLLVDDNSVDQNIRHGRGCALFVALKESPETVYTDKFADGVNNVLNSYLTSEKVPIAMNGIRASGYLFKHLMSNSQPLPPKVLTVFVKTMNHSSNDVKQLLSKVCSFLGKSNIELSPEFLKAVLPVLVNGTKEKNSYVRANSELSLVSVLKLRQGDAVQQMCLNLLDVGARESLNDVITKVLRKVAGQSETKLEELDDTIQT
nr:PREDICTED: eIF-2-alpha kinase activator GCN1 [Bemisia tabaci]